MDILTPEKAFQKAKTVNEEIFSKQDISEARSITVKDLLEQLKLKKLADKKSLEEVKTNIVNIKETTGKKDSKIKEIFTKRYKHYLGKITIYII